MQLKLDRLYVALEEISSALISLEVMNGMKVSKNFVDVSAGLNVRVNRLDKLVKDLKEDIKTHLVQTGTSIVQGNQHEAVMSCVSKSVLDTPRIRTFLGSQLMKFTITSGEKHLIFRAKS